MSAETNASQRITTPRTAFAYLHATKEKHSLGVLVLSVKGDLLRDAPIENKEDRFRLPFALCDFAGSSVLVYRRLAEGESDRKRPTKDDLDTVERMRTIGEKMGVPLSDYLIVCRGVGFDYSARAAQGWDR